MKSDAEAVLAFLRSNRTMAKVVVDFLIFAVPDAPPDIIKSALGDLHTILDDTERLLRELFHMSESLSASRLPRRSEPPLTPKQAIEALQTSLDIMQIEVEALLKKPWGTEEEFEKVARRRDHIIKMMGYTARYYKAVVQHRDPAEWTPEIDKRFAQFLKIKP